MRTDEQRRKAVEYLNRHPEQREKARARALVHIRRKRAMDPASRRRQAIYQEMAAEYGDECAICGGQPTNGRRLAIDHCHTTDEIRGLLCNKCNLLIGHRWNSEWNPVGHIEEAEWRHCKRGCGTGQMRYSSAR